MSSSRLWSGVRPWARTLRLVADWRGQAGGGHRVITKPRAAWERCTSTQFFTSPRSARLLVLLQPRLDIFLLLCFSFCWIILSLDHINFACLPECPWCRRSNGDHSVRGLRGWICTCDRRAIKSSSGRCVVDNVCGVGLNPESFTCYDTKVERNTVLAHVTGLRVSRGLPTLPERLPAALWSRCKPSAKHSSDRSVRPAQSDLLSQTLRAFSRYKLILFLKISSNTLKFSSSCWSEDITNPWDVKKCEYAVTQESFSPQTDDQLSRRLQTVNQHWWRDESKGAVHPNHILCSLHHDESLVFYLAARNHSVRWIIGVCASPGTDWQTVKFTMIIR